MSIDAMKQALDLLETSWGNGHEDTLKYWNETAQVLRQAIAEAEKQEPVAFVSGYYGGQCVILPIYKDKLFSPGTALYTTPVHASENTEKQEPVGWLDSEGRFSYFKHLDSDQPLYAAPREWVGLTEQDVHDAFQFTELIKQLSFDRERQEWCENFAAYLEAKLKEKNT